MYCKNCGNEVSDKAIACTKCGVAPLSERKFCQECGVETKENQVVCIKCGISLDTKGNNPKGKATDKKGEYDGFYCSSDDKVILGLCGGLAHKFNISSSTMRILCAIFGGFIYLVGLALPKYPTKNLK